MTRRAQVVAVLALCVLMGTAGADTVQATTRVSVAEPERDVPDFSSPTITLASDGERNDITAVLSGGASPPRWLVRDTAGLDLSRAGTHCTAVDEHSANCVDAGSYLFASTGDGGDTIHVSAGPGSSGVALIDGGDGDDTLVAGPGIRATFALTRGHDVVDGGPEGAAVDSFLEGTTVDLPRGLVTHGTDVTQLRHVTAVYAAAPARVVGTAGGDRIGLTGGTAIASGGADVLRGSGTFRAGSGNDSVEAIGSATVSCGPGVDDVTASVSSLLRLADDCERLAWPSTETAGNGPTVDPRPRPVPGRSHDLRLRVSCPTGRTHGCRGWLRTARTGNRYLAHFSVPAGRSRWVALRNGHGAAVRRGRRVTLRLQPHDARAWVVWSVPVVS
jgi:hypothetical protein